jgi:hypothetical protein
MSKKAKGMGQRAKGEKVVSGEPVADPPTVGRSQEAKGKG